MPQERSRVTLANVAAAAGVSVSTASAALGGSGRVSDATAERVRATARQLGYRLNHSARRLRSEGHSVVGVVVDVAAVNLDSNAAPALWWPRAVFALVDELGAQGVGAHVISAEAESALATLAIDALITMERPGGHAVIPQGLPFGVPIFLGGDVVSSQRATARIAPDYAKVARMALDHLHDSGSISPGLLSVPARVSFAEHLETAYVSWCSDNGCTPVIAGREGGSELGAIDRLLAAGCDGVFSLSNASADVLIALKQRVAVPDDVLLIALSEGLIEAHLSPSVSVVSLDGSGAGRRVAEAVLTAIRSGRTSDVEIEPRLIVGDSTRRA